MKKLKHGEIVKPAFKYIIDNDKLEVVESLMTHLDTIITPLNDIVNNLMSGRNEKKATTVTHSIEK